MGIPSDMTRVAEKLSEAVSFRVAKVLRSAVRKRLAAFTLAELIVVVAILAILATIGFIALSGYVQDSKATALASNVRSVYSAISAESARTSVSPRYYVIHDPIVALSGAIIATEGTPTVLTGGDWNQDGTNYSAGNPDYVKLKMNPEKFKVSSSSKAFSETVAYDAKFLTVGAADVHDVKSGKSRVKSLVQVAGISFDGRATVVGNYPTPTFTGASAGLIKDAASASATGALADGVAAGGPSSCPSASHSGFTIPSLPSGQSLVAYKSITNGTGSLTAACAFGTISYSAQGATCASGYVEGANFTCIADICGGTISDPNAHSTATSQGVSGNWGRSPTPGLCTWDCNSHYVWNSSSCTAVIPAAPSVAGSVRCGAGVSTLTATPPANATIDWYSAATGGIPVATGVNSYSPSVSVTSTFYAESRNTTTGAKSSTRTPVVLQVDVPPVGGTASWAAQRVCAGTVMTMNLSGQSGTVNRWQYSANGGAWVDWGYAGNTSIGWSTANSGYSNHSFRAVVKNGTCAETYSAATPNSIVDAPTVGGTMSASPNPVNYATNTTIYLGGQTGNVIQWEYYYTAWTAWGVGTPTSVLWTAYPGYYFRALIQNGVCPAQYSSQVYVTVNAPTYAWFLVGDAYGSYYGYQATVQCRRNDGAVIKSGNYYGDTYYSNGQTPSIDNYYRVVYDPSWNVIGCP